MEGKPRKTLSWVHGSLSSSNDAGCFGIFVAEGKENVGTHVGDRKKDTDHQTHAGNMNAHFESSLSDVKEQYEKENTHSITVVWSYSTSGEPEFAGQMSDSFLIHTLSVGFRVARIIEFNPEDCSANEVAPRTMFDLRRYHELLRVITVT